MTAIGVMWSPRLAAADPPSDAARPNIILVMADDMGWGQTSYYNHPRLKTPNLDAMAGNGLRFDRFYAGAPVCSPTRASVLTGRMNDRSGVRQHGYALRHQEQTIVALLGEAGYTTGHFGKWHLNGLRGPGVPILADDTHHPGTFGFDEWLSVTNFFDRDPILSKRGEFREFEGDSSEIVVDEAINFAKQQQASGDPFFAVIWYGSPHNPFRASDDDVEAFADLDPQSRKHYGELVAMDRSIGTLRDALRETGIAENTLLWFCSDNGGLPGIQPSTTGGLRGNKGTIYEGGLRVPAIVEWPAVITDSMTTDTPACTMDIFPTLVDVAGIASSRVQLQLDGISLRDWFDDPPDAREEPIAFRYMGAAAIVDNDYKLLTKDLGAGDFELYNVANDADESEDLTDERPMLFRRLRERLLAVNESVEASVAGADYPEGRVDPNEPEPRFWMRVEAYEPYFDDWIKRPEYRQRLQRGR